MHDQVAKTSGPWTLERAGSKETSLATPGLMAAVRRGRLSHDHDLAVAVQVGTAVTVPSETGPVLSARRSPGPVAAVKAAAWACQAAQDGQVPDVPRVF